MNKEGQNFELSADYSDLLELPHPTSVRHPRMPSADRAAQFAPFSALIGYDDAIEETARLTDSELQLTEEAQAELDRRQQLLLSVADRHPAVTITYFVPDPQKQGGAYHRINGFLDRVEEFERCLRLTDGTAVALDRICQLDSPLFSEFD